MIRREFAAFDVIGCMCTLAPREPGLYNNVQQFQKRVKKNNLFFVRWVDDIMFLVFFEMKRKYVGKEERMLLRIFLLVHRWFKNAVVQN